MQIVVFGTDNCKFCKKQKDFLENSFKDNEWLYVDVVKDKEGLNIAQSLNIDKIPTIVLFNKKNQEIFRKEGTLPCDRIFQTLHQDKLSIPVSKAEYEEIEKSKMGEILLSYELDLKKGQQIKIKSFENRMLCKANIISCRKVSLNDDGLKIEAQTYLNKGGRKDIGWKVSFSVNPA